MTGNLDPKTLYDFITGDFEDAWNAIAGVAGAAVHRGNFMFGRQAMSLRPSASSPKLRMEERPHTAAIEGDVAECSESNADGGTRRLSGVGLPRVSTRARRERQKFSRPPPQSRNIRRVRSRQHGTSGR